MLCCVHLTVISLSILKVLRVPLSFRCLIFKVLRTFRKVFCWFLPNLSQQCVNYYITLIFVCQHFFSNFLKALLSALKLFCCFCAFLKRKIYYTTVLRKVNLFFEIFLKKFAFYCNYDYIRQYTLHNHNI